MPEFAWTDPLPTGSDETPYRLLTTEGVTVVETAGRTFLEVDPEALRLLTYEAMHDIAHLLRPAHLAADGAGAGARRQRGRRAQSQAAGRQRRKRAVGLQPLHHVGNRQRRRRDEDHGRASERRHGRKRTRR